MLSLPTSFRNCHETHFVSTTKRIPSPSRSVFRLHNCKGSASILNKQGCLQYFATFKIKFQTFKKNSATFKNIFQSLKILLIPAWHPSGHARHPSEDMPHLSKWRQNTPFDRYSRPSFYILLRLKQDPLKCLEMRTHTHFFSINKLFLYQPNIEISEILYTFAKGRV